MAGRSADELAEEVGGVGLHAGQHVLVGFDRERCCGVPEPLRDDLDGDTFFDEQGRVGVSEVVEPDHRKPGVSADAFERLGDRVWVDGMAVAGGEHVVIGFAGDGLFEAGPVTPRLEDFDCGWVEVDAAPAVGGLAA